MAAAYLAGSVPFAQLASLAATGTDLRRVGTGTVSGTALYREAGFGPLAAAGVLEVAKGAVGPLLAGRDRPALGALATAAGLAGHNWSPWLGGAGGRGLSPAVGSLLATAPEGAALVLGGMALGRIGRQSAAGSLAAVLALGPLLGSRRGAPGRWQAAAVALPLVAKRLAGNRRGDGVSTGAGKTASWTLRLAADRLLFDRDPRSEPVPSEPSRRSPR